MRILSLALAVSLLSGCFLAPGMKMDEQAAVDRGRITTKDSEFRIQPITPHVLSELAGSSKAQRPDPMGNVSAYEYRVAAYDVLMVTVWDHPELTTPTGQFRSPEENGVRVNGDGQIFYPYIGVVSVSGKTVSEIRALLTTRLVRVIANPQLDVRVAAFRGRRAQVSGEVMQPTPVPITDVPLRVQDAIAMAHGFTPEADYSRVTLTRGGTVYRLDLRSLYEEGDTSQNWILTDGDVVNVADRSNNKVFVLGDVRQQTARMMVKARMTLAEALLGTGVQGSPEAGLEPQMANVSQIYVIRGDFQAPTIYRLDASSPDALLLATNFQMQPRDVVFVSSYGVSRWSRVMNQIVPTVTSLWEVYDVVQRTR